MDGKREEIAEVLDVSPTTVDRDLRFGVAERMRADGSVETPLGDLGPVLDRLRAGPRLRPAQAAPLHAAGRRRRGTPGARDEELLAACQQRGAQRSRPLGEQALAADIIGTASGFLDGDRLKPVPSQVIGAGLHIQ
jgi:hypothetical protein